MKRLGFWLAILSINTVTSDAFADGNGFASNGYGQPQSAPLFRSYFESTGRGGNELSMVQGDLFLTNGANGPQPVVPGLAYELRPR